MGLAAARGVDHRQAAAVRRPAASSTARNTGFPGWPDSLGLGKTTSQPGNPGWLVNRDVNAMPTAGGRPALIEARVLAVTGRRGPPGACRADAAAGKQIEPANPTRRYISDVFPPPAAA